MSLPANWSTVTVTGAYLNVDGEPLKGTVAFSTTTRVVDAAANVTVPPGVRQVSLDKDGKFSLVLPATDDPDVAPTGFTYRVDENLILPSGVRSLTNYLIQLPAATPTVDLADVVPVTAVGEVSPYLRAVDIGTTAGTVAAGNDPRLARMFHVKNFGALADGVTDDAPAIQATIAAATAAGGGEVRLGTGIYMCGSTITLPVNTFIALRGEGRSHVGGAKGTSLRRMAAFTGLLLDGVGTGPAGNQRIHFEISDMEIHGGDGTTQVARLSKASTSTIRNVRFTSSLHTLLQATEWFNCWLDKVVFNMGGNGTAAPASVFDGDPAAGSGNTVHVTDCEWEGNTGTDLRITGNPIGAPGGQDWAIAFSFSNPKLERSAGSFPLIDLDRAGAVQFTGGFFHLASSATGPHVVQKGTAVVPSRPNGFVNCEFSGNKWTGSGAGGDAVVPYFVDVTVGDLLLSNCSMNGSPTTAFVHIGAAVGANAVRMSNVAVTDRSKLLHDERPGSVYGYGSIPLVPVIEGVAPIVSVNRAIWALPDAATTTLTYATVPMPADASTGRPVRVRVMWYSDAALGDVRYTVGAKTLNLADDDITAGQADFAGTVTVPATANRTITTTVVTTVNVTPGTRFLAVRLQRIGADAADTCTGAMRVLAAEVLYERAL